MLSRRDFLKLVTCSTLNFSLTEFLLRDLVEAAPKQDQRMPVIWLELGSCTGESISLHNGVEPDFQYLITKVVSWNYDWLTIADMGEMAVKAIKETEQQEFMLVVQGAPTKLRHYDYVYYDGQFRSGYDVLMRLGKKAKYVVAVGGCATHGGPAAAAPNPGKFTGVQDVLDRKVINVPGCPSHPDWMMGTIYHLVRYGEPDLDEQNRPKLFFGTTIHDKCEQRTNFENGVFAKHVGEDGCLYKVGCKGPVTYADCPTRQWNNHLNWPVGARVPCIGCASLQFPDGMEPFYERLPNLDTLGVKARATTFAAAAVGLTTAGIVGHAGMGVIRGRIGRHWRQGTEADKLSVGRVVKVKGDFKLTKPKRKSLWSRLFPKGRKKSNE